MTVNPKDMSLEEQFEYLKKGSVDIIQEDELKERLKRSQETGTPLVVKVGFDPTAPDLHLGHTVILRKMRHFQDLGHTVIFLIGDFTGMIGDPSGLSKTRKEMTHEEVLANAETYKKQVFKILDPEHTVIDFNSRWLGKLGAEGFIRLAAKYTVARILERDDFANRLHNNQPIAMHEILYPLAQAYDSVALRADVEMGGTDQRFNLLVGRDIQREFGQPPQVVFITPLLEGLDGKEKMSKSLDNYIGIEEPPEEIFGKVMSISDELMFRYYELCTNIPLSQIEAMRKQVKEERVNPRELKAQLARLIITDFYDSAQAEEAAREFDRVFKLKETPTAIEERSIPSSPQPIWLPKLLTQLGMTSSHSQARRLIAQGGVYINGDKVTNPEHELDLSAPGQYLLKVGKRRFVKVIIT